MKYITTPVMIVPKTGALCEADLSMLCDPPLGFVDAECIARMVEIATAINEHDTLVAERDALVGACEAHMVWKRHVEDCLRCGMRLSGMRVKCSVERELQARSDELAEDALDLVRGEVSDG